LTALYFDCFSGASGDMILGALIDAGVKLEDVRQALGSLAITPETIWTEPVVRGGIRATKFNVRGETHPADAHHHDDSAHVHGHAGGGEPHRTLAEIFCLIDSSSLNSAAKDRTKSLFTRLGETEAAIHGTSLDRVHLHEVGALDSIIDIAGSVFALQQLGVDTILSSALNVGGGTVYSAHGRYPVPAPATARLLKGVPIYSGTEQVELVTPTGALLIAGYASSFGPLPAMRVERIGYGAGTRDFAQTPNVLRVLIGELDAAAPSQSVVVIEAEIDDMNPQIFGVVMDRLLAEGALDVFYTSIQMKKNRPGTLLTVIASPSHKDRLTATIFRETTTIGVRYREMARECLDRESITVTTELGPVRVKVARRGSELLNAAPEFDDCVRLATEHQVPTKHVQALAMKAYLETTKRGL
jgi:pyridinium-3,5-bisthiocarboxylic acid mononucleotide nickel chelatase